MAPVPAGGPSKVCFMVGSSLAQGDHASQLWKSFTWANTIGGGAEIVALRTTRYSGGCSATTIRKTITTTASPIRIFLIIRHPLRSQGIRQADRYCGLTMTIQ